MKDVKSIVKRAAEEAGFDLSGVASAMGARELEYFPRWIAAGHAGDMKYMEARDEEGELKRASLARVAPWARSVIVCAINYNVNQPYSTEVKNPSRGWISRYAWGREDYHEAVLRRLKRVEASLQEAAEGVQTRSYVDTGPIVERVFAKYAGVGWIGKNTCVINQQKGSWLFLGIILASVELEPDVPAADRCGSCTRCIEACPTDALLSPYVLDSKRCISYLTIEKRGAISEELRAGMGQQVFGCDICQDVCPWNRRAGVEGPVGWPELVAPPLERLAELTQDEFNRMFQGTPVTRAKYRGFLKNVAVAMGNSGKREYREALERLARSEERLVAEHAGWALGRLGA